MGRFGDKTVLWHRLQQSSRKTFCTLAQGDRANCDLPFRCPRKLMEISLGTRPSPTEKEAPTQQLEITASYKQNADNRSETINPGIGRVLKLVVYLY